MCLALFENAQARGVEIAGSAADRAMAERGRNEISSSHGVSETTNKAAEHAKLFASHKMIQDAMTLPCESRSQSQKRSKKPKQPRTT